MKKKATIIIPVAVTVIILTLAFAAFGHYKNVQAGKALAERSAIPKTEISSVTRMIESLGHRRNLQVSVLACKTIDDNSCVYTDKDIDCGKNIERQIAIIALNPVDAPICEDNIYNIVGVEASWAHNGTKITLKGDSTGWKTLSWVSENYGLEAKLPNHPLQFTIDQAENFKFKATESNLIAPSETSTAP